MDVEYLENDGVVTCRAVKGGAMATGCFCLPAKTLARIGSQSLFPGWWQRPLSDYFAGKGFVPFRDFFELGAVGKAALDWAPFYFQGRGIVLVKGQVPKIDPYEFPRDGYRKLNTVPGDLFKGQRHGLPGTEKIPASLIHLDWLRLVSGADHFVHGFVVTLPLSIDQARHG